MISNAPQRAAGATHCWDASLESNLDLSAASWSKKCTHGLAGLYLGFLPRCLSIASTTMACELVLPIFQILLNVLTVHAPGSAAAHGT